MEGGEDISENIKLERVTQYIEHPVPIEPPIEEAPAAPMPLMLTTKVIPHPAEYSSLECSPNSQVTRTGCQVSMLVHLPLSQRIWKADGFC